MSKCLIISLISTLLLSCSDNSEQEVLTESETIRIQLPSHCLNTYITQQIFEDEGLLYYYGYNYMRHSLDIFNLTEKKFEKSIRLDKEGPNGIFDVNSFLVVSQNEIIIANQKEITYVDDFGKKQMTIDLKSLKKDSLLNNTFIDFRSQNDLVLDKNTNCLLVHIREEADYSSSSFFSHPILAEINLQEKNLKSVPIYFPETYSKNFFGDLSYPHISSVNDITIVSFPVSQDYYIKKDGKWKFVSPNSEIRFQVTKPTSKSEFNDKVLRIDYLYNATYYGKAHYIDSLEKISRVYIYGYNEEGQSKRRIEIVKEDFSVASCYELSSNHAINYFMSNKSLYINRMNEQESYIIFDKITLASQ